MYILFSTSFYITLNNNNNKNQSSYDLLISILSMLYIYNIAFKLRNKVFYIIFFSLKTYNSIIFSTLKQQQQQQHLY